MHRTIIYFFIIVLLSFIYNSNIIASNGVDRLHVKGNVLVGSNGNTIVLKGVSLGWHNWWPRFYNASVVKNLKDKWNCSVVRVAMGVDPKGAYLSNSEGALKCVHEVVDAAIDNDMYVIIDWHSHKIHTKEACDFFRYIVNYYKDSPNVIYEIFNEPVDDSWNDVKKYSETVIKIIRKIDYNAIILVGTPHWDQDLHLAADKPLSYSHNIMYSLHFYSGTHKDSLRKNAEYALNKGIPIFVSECAGMNADGNGDINIEEWKKWIDWMDKWQLCRVAWSISDKDETCSMIDCNASSYGNWEEKDLTDWAHIVRSTFLK